MLLLGATDESTKTMAISDLTSRDLYRLSQAFLEGRKRDAKLIPSMDELMPAIKEAVNQDGDILDNLVPIFGEPIRRGFDLLREVIVEQHSEEYAEQLWDRFMKKSNE
jgi:hypothetical protein